MSAHAMADELVDPYIVECWRDCFNGKLVCHRSDCEKDKDPREVLRRMSDICDDGRPCVFGRQRGRLSSADHATIDALAGLLLPKKVAAQEHIDAKVPKRGGVWVV